MKNLLYNNKSAVSVDTADLLYKFVSNPTKLLNKNLLAVYNVDTPNRVLYATTAEVIVSIPENG